jgi:hypothetical protein
MAATAAKVVRLISALGGFRPLSFRCVNLVSVTVHIGISICEETDALE